MRALRLSLSVIILSIILLSGVLAEEDAYRYNDLGIMHLKSGRYDEASGEFIKALAVDPRFLTAKYNLALTYRVMGKTEKALEKLKEILKESPEFVEAHYTLGTLLIERYDFAGALEPLTKTITIKANHADGWANLGYALFMVERYDEALTAYAKAEFLNPKDAKIFFYRGLTYESLRDYQSAIRSYASALSLNPDYEDAKAALVYLEIIAKCDNRLAEDPEDTEPYHRLGELYMKRGLYNEAIKEYKKLLDCDPLNEGGRIALAAAFRKIGLYEDAATQYVLATAANDLSQEAYKGLWEVYKEDLKNAKEAEFYKHKYEELCESVR
ncbi:MAG: tetratricopeptide repeat protein [Candidatus Omnitrophica bacterium]|nr:tetratricopeptide repeat protein [Candidatus Omnitrophota bacterium]